MSSEYYNTSGTPATGAPGSSAPMRGEFTAIAAGFALLPALSGNGGKAVIVNAGGTALTVTTGTLALAGNLATTGAFNTTLAQTASVTLTLPAVSGTLATLAGSETLSNKTLVSPALGTPASGVLTNCTGTASGLTAGNVTTNANLTGVITSVGNATSISAQTGTGTTFVMSASPTLSGTVTLPDGTTLASTGLANAGSYSTASTPFLNFTPTYTYTGTGVVPSIVISPVLTPAGASSTQTQALIVGPTLNSSITTTTYANIQSSLTLTNGSTGTITTARMFSAGNPTLTGANAITNLYGYFVGGFTNGNGITSGTVTNVGVIVPAFQTTAGSGGTIINNGVQIALPIGVNAGTTTNTAVSITGAGQTGGAVNWAINSTSTAKSQIQGDLMVGTTAAIATSAVSPFLFCSTGSGTPTGVPTNAAAGLTAMYYDTSAHKIWFYDQPAGAWKGVAVA